MFTSFRLLLILILCSSFQIIEDQNPLHPLSPALSLRQTHKFILDNGLSVYLISDPHLPKSAAALSVQAGSWMDPQQHLGLAHFLEHMLFLATEKYPIESEYDRFLKAHGGYSNAFTEPLYTNYSFEVDNSAFEQALDRFSCFFYQPLLSPSGLSREKNAVHSEYMGHLEKDDSRRYFVQKFLSNPHHPEHLMNIGNKETLKEATTETLRTWFKQHYNASSMYLSLYTAHPPELVEQWIKSKFSSIQGDQQQHFQATGPILDPKFYKHAIFIEPIQEKRELTFVWELPVHFGDAAFSRPYDLISHILGHEGENSLLSALRAQDLASGLSAGKTLYTHNGALFYLQIDLTPKGIKNFQTVIKRVFQAIKRIEESPFPSYVFTDLQQKQKIDLQYPKLQTPFEVARKNAVGMREEALDTYPYNSSVIQNFRPALIKEMASLLNVDRCQIYVLAKESETHIEAQLEEPWMHIPFAVRPLPLRLIEECRHPLLDPAIDFPIKNPFMPTSLDLKHPFKQEQSPNPTPQLLFDRPHGKLYFAPDHTYGIPQSSFVFTLRTPYVHNGDASSIVHADLSIDAFLEAFNSYGYEAKMAGLDYEVSRHFNGVTFKINGYSEKTPQLLQKIIEKFSSLRIDVASFQRLKNKRWEEYQNESKKSPLLRGLEAFKRFFYFDYIAEAQKTKEITAITHESINRYLEGLFQQSYLEAVAYGNLNKEEAENLWLLVWKSLDAAPYPKQEHLPMRLALPPQTEGPLYMNHTVASKGNALLLAIEQDAYSFQLHACHELAAALLSPIYFSTLRTQQQTGYQVALIDQEIEKQLLMLFVIESHTHEPRDLLARTECVLEGFAHAAPVQEEHQKRFETLKEAKILEMLTPPENMPLMGERLYTLAFSKEADFNWYRTRAESFRQLNFDTFKEQLDTLLGRNNHRRIAFLMHGKVNKDEQFKYKSVKSWKWLHEMSRYRTQKERD